MFDKTLKNIRENHNEILKLTCEMLKSLCYELDTILCYYSYKQFQRIECEIRLSDNEEEPIKRLNVITVLKNKKDCNTIDSPNIHLSDFSEEFLEFIECTDRMFIPTRFFVSISYAAGRVHMNFQNNSIPQNSDYVESALEISKLLEKAFLQINPSAKVDTFKAESSNYEYAIGFSADFDI